MEIRRMPYPPSLRRRPARIIDPAIGASTWAFGSQRWKINIGIFTKKASTVKDHQIYIRGPCINWIEKILRDIEELPLVHEIAISLIRRGSLAQIVYNIKYSPAWRRSGWYPQPKTRRRVGIKDASNIM